MDAKRPPRRRTFAPLPCLLCAAGAAACAHGLALGAGSADLPGPGLWPALAGGGLALFSLPLVFPPAEGDGTRPPRATPDRRALIGLATAALLWIACLIPLGWAAATCAAVPVAARAAGNGGRAALRLTLVVLVLLGGISALAPLPEGLWLEALRGAG